MSAPDGRIEGDPEWPAPVPWAQRGKDSYPMPGGYRGYLASTRRILQHVVDVSPESEALHGWVRQTLGVSETNARLGVGFMRRVGMIVDRGGTVEVAAPARRFLESGDPSALIALLHSKVRFIGEMLEEARAPISDSELLDRANRFYGFSWDTKAQIRRRRGWLESAGLIAESDEGLVTTPAGRALLDRLVLQPRTSASESEPLPVGVHTHALPNPGTPIASALATSGAGTLPDDLIGRLIATSTDSGNPDAFERVTAEAFNHLGFQAEWIGGSGKTDVLLVADLGKGHSYRVVVDCKSTGRGSVNQQIDWETIDEHRVQHEADHAAIVAPAFGGGRLADRASRHGTVMLTADDLAELLRQHRRTPLGLDTYRLLFQAESAEDGIAAIGEQAAEAQRWTELLRLVVELLTEMTPRMGPLSGRDVHLLIAASPSDTEATEWELESVLCTLASPLVGVCWRDGDGRFRLTRRPRTAAQTLRALAIALGSAEDLESSRSIS